MDRVRLQPKPTARPSWSCVRSPGIMQCRSAGAIAGVHPGRLGWPGECGICQFADISAGFPRLAADRETVRPDAGTVDADIAPGR
jgi:hypothetical protein